MPFTLPPLPYASDVLEPHIDKMTMEIHHGKHHGAYVTNLNKALESAPDLANKTVEELLAKGILKPYRPRVPEKNLWAFLEEHGWELERDSLEFESLDEEPQRWVKPVPTVTSERAAALAKMQAQRRHTETIKVCRYCGRQLRGNVRAFHENRCPKRPKA